MVQCINNRGTLSSHVVTTVCLSVCACVCVCVCLAVCPASIKRRVCLRPRAFFVCFITYFWSLAVVVCSYLLFVVIGADVVVVVVYLVNDDTTSDVDDVGYLRSLHIRLPVLVILVLMCKFITLMCKFILKNKLSYKCVIQLWHCDADMHIVWYLY